MEYLIDTDCDGAGDVLMTEPDDKSLAITYAHDDDGDGELDSLIFDDDRDGNFDFALYDTDGDGMPDMKGEYRDREDEPYRLERIDPKTFRRR